MGQALNFINKARYLPDGFGGWIAVFFHQNHPVQARPYMHEVFETKVATTPTRYPKELQYNLSHLDEENLTSFDVDRNKNQPIRVKFLDLLTSTRPCVKWRDRILANAQLGGEC